MDEFPIALAISCGSSSIKFFVLDASDHEALMSGITDGINSRNVLLSVNGGEPAPLAHHSYEGALKAIAFELEKQNLDDDMALVGHRIAHDGSIFTESAIIADEVTDNTRRVSPLTPLHNYVNLSDIESAQQLFPGVTQVVIFDTSFHQTMAPEAYLYGLPWGYCEELSVRYYGFHGTPHHYVSQRTHSLLNLAEDDSGLIVTHLDNNALTCAVRGGQSVDTSMGVTSLGGSMMDTRSGDVNLGAMSWIASQTSQNLRDLECVVNKESGLLGISGLSPDLHVLEKAWHEGHEHVRLAIKAFAYRIARHIAGHAVSLHRLDGIMFAGGIEESSGLIRRLIMEHLTVLDTETDTEINNRSNSFGERTISNENTRVTRVVTPIGGEKTIVSGTIHLDRVNALAEFT